MAHAQKVARITINGTMFGGLEHWSTGFYMGATGADATAPTEEFLGIAAAAWKTFFQNSTSWISGQYQVTGVRGALLDTAGKTIPGSIANYFEPTPYSGGAGPSAMPPQCALVATLVTATPRGLGSKGRMYLPGICATVNSSGHIASADANNIAINLRTFFAALNGTVERPGTLITASKGSKPPLVGPGVNRVVTNIKVGNVYDTQRRRRNELVEVYSTSPAL